MFKYHKYCVVEVSGLLMGVEDLSGSLSLYLIDDKDFISTRSSGGGDNLHPDISLLPGRDGEKIQVADRALIDYLIRNAPYSHSSQCKFILSARLTGTVNMDGEIIELQEISEAVMKDEERVIHYRADS